MRAFREVGKKIIGVRHNFHSRIAELGIATPTEPELYLKSFTSIVTQPNPIHIPLDHEVEHQVSFGVIIRKKGSNITAKMAPNFIGGYVLALDLVARDMDQALVPSSMARSFNTFCPVSRFVSRLEMKFATDWSLWCDVNGKRRQWGLASDMIFGVNELIERISKLTMLMPGDLILTGTPKGADLLKVGDVVEAGVGFKFVTMKFHCVPKPSVLHGLA